MFFRDALEALELEVVAKVVSHLENGRKQSSFFFKSSVVVPLKLPLLWRDTKNKLAYKRNPAIESLLTMIIMGA